MNILKRLLSSRKRIISLVILLSLIGFIGWRGLAGKEEKPQFQTAKVERGMIISSVSASGQIIASNLMEITTQASGVVKTVYVQNGDTVKKGDKIAEISLDQQGQQKNASAWSSYLSAKNSLESAKTTQYSLQADMFSKWDTFKELAESDDYQEGSDNRNLPEFHIPEKEWLAAEAKYKNQQAVINQAQAAVNNAWLSYQLSSPIIVAPMDGVITGLTVVEGMIVSNSTSDGISSSAKVAIVQTDGMPIASFNLSEIDVSQVTPGQKATIVLDSFPDKTYTGKVVSVDKVGVVTSGVTQYQALVRFDSSASEILPHMAATARIIIESKENVLLVPSSAVQTQDNQSFVRRLKNEQVQLVAVETGLTSDTQTEIVSGLAEGDVVATGTISSTSSQQGEISPFGGMGGMIRMIR